MSHFTCILSDWYSSFLKQYFFQHNVSLSFVWSILWILGQDPVHGIRLDNVPFVFTYDNYFDSFFGTFWQQSWPSMHWWWKDWSSQQKVAYVIESCHSHIHCEVNSKSPVSSQPTQECLYLKEEWKLYYTTKEAS